jgi:O-antigen/teichoic acid export membrane protein
VGNSLRNSVAGAVTEADRRQLQSEFLGLFRLLSRVCLVALLLLLAALAWVDLLQRHLLASLLLYIPYLLMLPFLLGTNVLQGAGRVALQSLLQASAGWVFFLFVGACYLAGVQVGLATLAAVYSLAFVGAMLVVFQVAQRLQGWQLAPRTLLRGASVPVDRVRVGISFLVLQASSLVLYGMGNAIIYSHLGPGEVARYDVVNKIFQVGLGLYNIMISVMWSEISRQRSLGNIALLRRLYRRMLALSLLFSALACLLATFMPVIVRFWTGSMVAVSLHEALVMAALVSIQAVAYVGAVFLNAFERITI